MPPRSKKLDGAYYARLALDYFDHPKIGNLSAEAIIAHLEMIVYARRYLTDGHIPKRVANRFGSESLSELASNDPDAPSIVINDDGSVILHGYADAQETKAEVEERRQVNALNGKKGGRPKNPVAKRTETQSVSETKPSRQAEGEGEEEEENSPTESVPRKRAHQIPDDWTPTPEHRQLATDKGIDIDLEIAKVRDWSKGGNNRRIDWDAVVRNWIRNARPDRQQRPNRDVASARGIVQAHQDLFGGDS